MAFMAPQYTNETFVGIYDDVECTDIHLPESVAEGEVFERIVGKWWCRLSAPGYLDCTDWSGPFDTEDEARQFIRDMYEVDPDTGGDLEDEEE